MRLGFIIIDLSELKYDLSKACGLYDVISETEEHHGKVKVNCIIILNFYFSLLNNFKNIFLFLI